MDQLRQDNARDNRVQESNKWGPGTVAAHAGDDPQRYYGAVTPPIFETSLFAFEDFDACVDSFTGRKDRYVYTRGRNPTVEAAEVKVAAFEGGESAKFFSSGMAAISAVLLSQLEQGSHIVCIQSVYTTAAQLITEWLPRFGVETTFVDGTNTDAIEEAIRDDTRLIYLESPSSTLFELQDLAAVARMAKKRGILTVIDNSWASPIFQRPLQLGIDVVIHTASKYLGGHSDLVGGVVVGSRHFIQSLLHNEHALLGAAISPFEAWLSLRGMRTLAVRLKHHHESGSAIAQHLEKHPKVRRVIHPGLTSHPQHVLAKRQMTGYGGLFSLELDTNVQGVRTFTDELRLVTIGISWGGFESLIFPAGAVQQAQGKLRPGQADAPETLVRLFVGLEDTADLLDDLTNALDLV